MMPACLLLFSAIRHVLMRVSTHNSEFLIRAVPPACAYTERYGAARSAYAPAYDGIKIYAPTSLHNAMPIVETLRQRERGLPPSLSMEFRHVTSPV